MPIPAFEKIMLPLLHDLENGDRTGQESLDALAAHFQLTPAELAIRNPSGRAATFSNRIGWAKSHLKSAGLIESPRPRCLSPDGARAPDPWHQSAGDHASFLGSIPG